MEFNSVSGTCGDGATIGREEECFSSREGQSPAVCTVDTPHTLNVKRDPARKDVHDDTVHGDLKSGRRKSVVEGACHSAQQLLSGGLPRSSREREDAPGRSCMAYL